MQSNKEDAFNVMVLTSAIILIIIVSSIAALSLLTHNLYLDSYFALEAFFDAQNTAASSSLAAIAFAESPTQWIPILIIVVIDNLSRILIVSFIIAAVIDFLSYANVEQMVNDFRAKRMKDHVIICGYNDLASRLMARLREVRIKYIILDPRKTFEAEFAEKKIVGIVGDFTKEEELKDAGIERASAIVIISENDVDNIVAAMVARRLNPKVKVMIRLADERVRKHVYGIGADMAVIPEYLSGIDMGEFVARSGGA
ncbi:MAG: NAD-binding protein [Candidatus Marsarchaeota archaeon]|nr:NAD-binding protein [Candidatus Marsarchaeota archaeon]